MRWRHSRKGIMEGEPVENQSDHQILAIKLTKTVPGMRKPWFPGETHLVRRDFVQLMDDRLPAESLQEEQGGEKDGVDG